MIFSAFFAGLFSSLRRSPRFSILRQARSSKILIPFLFFSSFLLSPGPPALFFRVFLWRTSFLLRADMSRFSVLLRGDFPLYCAAR